MKHPQLFPKPPKRMKEPTKDRVRLRAELAEAQLAYRSTPHWWRIWNRIFWRIREKDKPVRLTPPHPKGQRE